ncbi:MAG: Hsp33 family molecular chaperone HslO [Acutalibacteraceae bacterium]
MLKQKNATVTLKVNGGGPLGTLVAISDSKGNCRGNVTNPEVNLPLKDNGKLDVGGAVGKDGLLLVIRDYGEGEPYMGQIELVSGEIAEDITNYFATSEQIPTVCALGVLLDKDDHKVLLAGGLLIQALPGADDAALEKLEKNVMDCLLTTMLAQGLSIEDIYISSWLRCGILDEYEVNYACPQQRACKRALTSLPADEILQIAMKRNEAKCQYCERMYEIGKSELEELPLPKREQRRNVIVCEK